MCTIPLRMPVESAGQIAQMVRGGSMGARRCRADRRTHNDRSDTALASHIESNTVMTRERLEKAVSIIRKNPGISSPKLCGLIDLQKTQSAHLKEAITYFDSHVYGADDEEHGFFYDEGQR